MPILIDTNVAIHLRDGDAATLERLEPFVEPPLLSVISRVELESGVYRHSQSAPMLRVRLDRILAVLEELPFGRAEAVAYGTIVAACGFSRARLVDRMIAATAIAANVALVTYNPRDFRDIPGLEVLDWGSG